MVLSNKPLTPGDVLCYEDQQTYQRSLAMLLYLVKYAGPDIANAVRELGKQILSAPSSAFKELKSVLKFVIDTSEYSLKLEPNINHISKCSLLVYSDSDWAGDKIN
jgi:hypothetical protein